MKKILLFCLPVLISFAFIQEKSKPAFYIIGDSTVKNGSGKGEQKLWGWGSFLPGYFDSNLVSVQNYAIGGRSSRTFITEGRWEKITAQLKAGDYVIMQFGHNDGGPLDDTARARGSIKGIGDESKEIYNPITKKQEVVHTYGWYMRKYVNEAKAKGAIPIVCSPVPRNVWKDGKVERSNNSYTLWAKQIANETGAYFIDLNNTIADRYEKLGEETVKQFFPVDHTHPNEEGSRMNAAIVLEALFQLKIAGLEKLVLR
ncbi:MAG TPA: rhamnogalacturonan acetylesterase [Phnomibacter sp.]|nr:rhamnogalacturonan acetylesterase [Phnomibacter sp.]